MADEFKIVASLNIPESASRINKDIPKLEGQAKHLKIVADLNPTLSIKNIQATLNKMNNNANIKIGIDTSGLNSVQGVTQNITNGLKSVQIQAQQTVSAIREVTTSMSANDISNKMVSEFQKSFNIVGENAKNTQQTFKALFAELNNAWYSENEEKYLKVLEQIYDIAQKTTKVVKQSKSEISALVDQVRSELTDGSKAFISPQVRKELEYLLGTSKQIQSVLSTVYGVGKWSFSKGRATDILANGDKGVLGRADEIVEAYNKIQSIKSSSEYTILDSFDRDRESIDNCMRSVLNLSNAYRDLNGIEHTYIQGLGWFEEVASENEKVTASLNTVQKEAKETAIALGEIGHNFISNNKVQATFSSIKQAEEYFKSLNLGDVSLSLNKGSLQGLTDFTVKIKSATGEVERFRYAVNNVGDDKNPILEYNLTNINASNDAVQRLIESQQKAQDKVKALRTDLASTLKSVGNGYSDPNAVKPIVDDTHLKNLNTQYVHALRSIADLKNADDTTMASMKANAESEIEKLKQMVKQYQNAEYAATSLRTKDIGTIKTNQTNELNEFIAQINRSKVPIDTMTKDIEELKIALNGIGDKDSLTKFLNQFDNAKSKFESVKATYQSIADKIKELQRIQNSGTFNKNSSDHAVINLKQQITALLTEYEKLKTQLNSNVTPQGLTDIGNKLTQLNASFNDATTTAKRFETELSNDNGAEKQAQRVALLKAQLTALEKANPKAMKQYGDAIKSLMATLNNNPDTRAIERVTKDIQLLRREINNANLAGKTLWQTLKEKAGKFVGWMSLTGIISSIWREMRQMVTNVVEIDKAMTNLKKVTDETDTTYARFLKNANQQAKELHSTVTDLVEQVATWSKLGYSLSESQNLAKTSMIYSNVGEVDNTTAVSDLVTVMKAFNIESEKSIRIVDSLNELGKFIAPIYRNIYCKNSYIG